MSIQQHVTNQASLLPYNSFGIEQQAEQLFILKDQQLLPELHAYLKQRQLPLLILGQGSNTLLLEDFKGLALVNRLSGIEVTEDEESYLLHVAAGEDWPRLVEWCLAQGYYGLENLALIPGTVGAAPVQNIGAYGVELANYCEAVEYFDLVTGEFCRLTASECHFAYRDSIFKRDLKGRALISKVELRLPKRWSPNLNYAPLNQLSADSSANVIFNIVVKTRQAKLPDPKVLGNAGSFFKNPEVEAEVFEAVQAAFPKVAHYPLADGRVKIAAGWLIDQLGLKGEQLGGAAVHQQQALVLVNKDQATAHDVLHLCHKVRRLVHARYGLQLEPEVRFIGAVGEVNAPALLDQLNA